MAILLATALVSMPVSATQTPILDESIIAMPTIIDEEITLREQNTKHFLLSDGSYTAVVYDEPVHYMKGNE